MQKGMRIVCIRKFTENKDVPNLPILGGIYTVRAILKSITQQDVYHLDEVRNPSAKDGSEWGFPVTAFKPFKIPSTMFKLNTLLVFPDKHIYEDNIQQYLYRGKFA